MGLGEKQELFTKLICQLTLWIYDQGYAVRDGDAYRDPRVHGEMGIKKEGSYSAANSYHKQKLARDLNLFKDGKYLTSTADHAFIGEKWKSMHPLCTWGGDFKSPDGNHYSFGESRQ